MGELEGQLRPSGPQINFAWTNGKELATEASGSDAERDVDDAVDHQHPHRGEMPEQSAGEPVAQGDLSGETQNQTTVRRCRSASRTRS